MKRTFMGLVMLALTAAVSVSAVSAGAAQASSGVQRIDYSTGRCTASANCAEHGENCPSYGRCTASANCAEHGENCPSYDRCTASANCAEHGENCPSYYSRSRTRGGCARHGNRHRSRV